MLPTAGRDLSRRSVLRGGAAVGAALLGGALLLLWPEAELLPQVAGSSDGAALSVSGAF